MTSGEPQTPSHAAAAGPTLRETITDLVGFLLIWLVFDRMASLLKSGRGEWGVAVCALVVAT